MAPSHHHRHRALASYLQLYHTEIIIAISGNCRFWDRVKVKPFMAIWAPHSGPPPTSSPQYGSTPLTHFLFLALAVSFWSQLPIWRIQHYLIYPSCKMLRSPVVFWVPQNQTYQFLILAQTQKLRKQTKYQNYFSMSEKIPIYLSTCLSIGWCTTFITFVSWSCPFSFFSHPPWPETSKPLTPSSPSHSSQSSAKTPPGPRRPSPASDLIKALSGTADPFFCVNIGWVFKM